MGVRGLSGFSNYLKDCNTGRHNWYKAIGEGEKEKKELIAHLFLSWK
jgi:hypothetical protein